MTEKGGVGAEGVHRDGRVGPGRRPGSGYRLQGRYGRLEVDGPRAGSVRGQLGLVGPVITADVVPQEIVVESQPLRGDRGWAWLGWGGDRGVVRLELHCRRLGGRVHSHRRHHAELVDPCTPARRLDAHEHAVILTVLTRPARRTLAVALAAMAAAGRVVRRPMVFHSACRKWSPRFRRWPAACPGRGWSAPLCPSARGTELGRPRRRGGRRAQGYGPPATG